MSNTFKYPYEIVKGGTIWFVGKSCQLHLEALFKEVSLKLSCQNWDCLLGRKKREEHLERAFSRTKFKGMKQLWKLGFNRL